MKKIFTFILITIAAYSFADTSAVQGSKDFKHFSVHYSVFSSTFVPADVARAYGIKRSAYESLLNISISPLNEYGALPGKIEGTLTNLIQQQKVLEFIEINEKNATYYLAPLRINGEETAHVSLNIRPDGSDEILNLEFTTKLYSDK